MFGGGMVKQAIQGAKLGAYNTVGRVVSGWVTSLLVGFIGANSGGASAILESAIAALAGVGVGLAAGAVGGSEVGVGVMSGGWGIAYENVILTYGGTAASTAMRPLGGYSQLSGYSRLNGQVIIPAGVPMRRVGPITSRSFAGVNTGRHQGSQQQHHQQ
jgi:hypothetical protein